MADLETIASELYALLPAEFTAARNERARAEGGELGAAVKALSKPSPAAWATNLLARAKPDDVAQLLALGDVLREAQDGADRATLTRLGSQRRRVVAALAKQAGALAKEAGQAVNATALDDIQRTLNAGMSDAGAAAAVTSGRLVRALAGDGLDAVDLEHAVGGPLPATTARTKSTHRSPSKKVIEAARKARAEAEARLREATEAADSAEEAEESADRRRKSLVQEREELRAHLADVEAELSEASRLLEEATRVRKATARDLERAAAAAD